jgi:cell wall-associated NlpC family hydrolase
MARPGDILCYAYGSGKRGNRVSGNSHVGIYTGDGKQIECAAGHGVTKSDVDKDNLIEIVRFGSAGISASYASYNGGESKSRHGF